MTDPVRQLYEAVAYPPMSHPAADPAVTTVAAQLGGLEPAPPRTARILEIGCGSGHHLIPLALRWPAARLTGIDLAADAIALARGRAAAAGAANLDFHAVDLRGYEPAGGPFDCIIAHGFFSWVPDAVKRALFDFCRENLSPSGFATVSFNTEAGWRARWPVIAKARAIRAAGAGSWVEALAILREVTPPADAGRPLIDDMLAKGESILPFDDFAPVNDAWPVDRFVHAAAAAGLRWLGESEPAANLPRGIDAAGLRARFPDPLAFQNAVDEASRRTFRSAVLCRAEAPVAERISLATITGLAVRRAAGPADDAELAGWIGRFAPACVPFAEIEAIAGTDRRELARRVFAGISSGWLEARCEPCRYDPRPSERPQHDRFRRFCAENSLPLVDAWHRPCAFPPGHYPVLAAMDGSRTTAQLAGIARQQAPELDFQPWLDHLAHRGMFA